jgi:ABC-type transporter Mla MlaB component
VPHLGRYGAEVTLSALLEARSYEHGDHVCWVFDSAEDLRVGAAEFLTDGAERGEQLLFVGDGDLGLGELVASGQLTVTSADSLYEPDGSFDVDDQVDRYRSLTQRAIAAGRTGFRVAADATPLVTDADDRQAFLSYELAVDRYIAGAPMTALCAYHRGTLGAGAAELACVHRTHTGVGADDAGFSLVADGDAWRLEGELDLANREAFHAAMAAVVAVDPDGDVLLDLSSLAFADVASVALLVELRGAIAPRHLVVHDPSRAASRIADALRWPL